MRRLLLALLALLFALIAAGPAEARFSHGVAAGEVTSTSAIVWARAGRAGSAWAELSHTRGFRRILERRTVHAFKSRDYTVQTRFRGLKPRARYFYRFCLTRGSGRARACTRTRSSVGTFVTAPRRTARATIRFAWSGDTDAQPARGETTPFYNSLGDRNFAVYKAMAAERNDFNVNLGDTIYSDSEVGAGFVNGAYRGSPPALTVRQKWAKYKQNIALPNLQRVRSSAAFFSHPDDHEWINDFGQNETLTGTNAQGKPFPINGRKLYPIGVKAFRDYAPVSWTKKSGFYRVFHWGKNLDVFFLDERSFRSAKAGSDFIHTCDNPLTKKPDLGPFAPPGRRAFFANVIDAFAQPVTQACLDTINSPKRTFLGKRQLRTFLRAVKASKATWKVIMNETPIQRMFALPYDFWEGYEYERQLVLRYLDANAKNVVWLATDHHGNLAGPIRYKTLPEEGGPVNSKMYEIATGPVATMTYKREINAATGGDPATSSTGTLIDQLVLEPEPTDADTPGLGLDCSAIDVFSYGEVRVTAKRLTVQLKDQNSKPVHEDSGTKPPCPTFRIDAK